MIVIGVLTAYIWSINTMRIIKHGNKIKSLQRMITKVGIATLLTNVNYNGFCNLYVY